MWGRRKGTPSRTRGRIGAFIDEDSQMEGKYTCAGTVVLDAKFQGEITSKDTLIIDERAVVHATIQAVTLVVRGELVGSATASERVELKSTARVTGDIEAPIIVMEEGAVHDGQSRMAKAKSAAGPPLSLVVSGEA
jgi:cytoskeletal protein CcmA (bactofilin family)